MNTLYYGDNLDILRAPIASESVDLIYLDPPFNSNASYKVLFKAPDDRVQESQSRKGQTGKAALKHARTGLAHRRTLKS